MKNYKIKISFVSSKGPKARANKTSINFIIFISIFVKNCLLFDAIHDFSVWLRIGSNPVDINRFQSHTGKYFLLKSRNHKENESESIKARERYETRRKIIFLLLYNIKISSFSHCINFLHFCICEQVQFKFQNSFSLAVISHSISLPDPTSSSILHNLTLFYPVSIVGFLAKYCTLNLEVYDIIQF